MFGLNIKFKLICILCFILSLFSILMAYFNPAHGYELSLYNSTPPIVWISLIFSILGGISIIIYIVYRNQSDYYNYCFLGLLILLFDRIILLYIPYIRGYYSWRGDNISHFGILKEILIFGHIPSDLVYPITHILLSELVYITGLSNEIIANHSTALISVFYVISIYLLATSSLVTKKEQILAVTSIAGVFFSGYDVYLMPNGWSLLYLPIVLFFYFKSLTKKYSMKYTILFLITLILYPFFHPLSTVVLILMLVVIGLMEFLIPIFENKQILLITSSFSLTPILLETAIFFPWILSFQKFNLNIKMMYYSIIAGSSPNVISSMSSTVGKLSLTKLDFLRLLFRLMGQHFIFLIFFFLSFVLLLKYSNYRKNNKNLIILLSITLFIGLMYVFYLFNILPGLQAMGSDRLQAYLVIFTPIFAGFVLSYIITRKMIIHKFNLAPMVCVVIILIASVVSIHNLYPSPYVMQPNPSITQMDMNGAEWLLNFKDSATNSVYIMSPVYRFLAGSLGHVEAGKLFGSSYKEANIMDHFNYTISNNLGNSYTQNEYFMMTMFDKIVYETVWNVVGRFHYNDFKKLEEDISVDRLYSNGDTSTYYIHSFV